LPKERNKDAVHMKAGRTTKILMNYNMSGLNTAEFRRMRQLKIADWSR
jgi:hypothetical protein